MATRKGRAPTNVEFMRTIREISGLPQGEFANACGKAPANMSNYLFGTLVPGRRVLETSLEHLYEWNIKALMELGPIPSNLNNLPRDPGVYIIYDSAGNVLYIGKARNFRTEVRQTLGRCVPVAIRFGPKLDKKKPGIRKLASHLSLYRVTSARARHNLEALLLRVIANQSHNSNVAHFR